MPVLSLACHLPHNTPNIPSRYNNEQTTKQTKAINNSYIYISHVNVTQTVPDISPLMPMHQDPLLVCIVELLVSSVICRFHGLLTCAPRRSIVLSAGQLCCNFFGQPGSVSKFPPFFWVKLWVGWVGRGYTEISRYFPASGINWVTLVTKIKILYSLRF